MPKHLFSSLILEYTLDVGLANARLVPDACQGNYFLQIGKKHLQKLYFVWGLVI